MTLTPRLARTTFLISVSLIALSCSDPGPPETPLAITNISVIPMDGDRVIENQTVVIESGRITGIAPAEGASIPAGAARVDGTGNFLMPALADMHAHVRRAEGHQEKDYLRAGVMVVRNMQGESAHLRFRRSNPSWGFVFRTAGQALAGLRIDRHHRIVETAEEGRSAVREQVEAGYDYIKVYSFLTVEVYDAILDEARQLRIPVIGHVSDDVKATRAIAAGQSSLEHLYGYFWDLEAENSPLLGEWEPRRLFHAIEIDTSKVAPLARLTAEAGVWNCPTLWRKDNSLTSPLAQEAWDDPSLRDLGHSNRMLMVRALHEAGAGLLAGTDDRAEIIHEELALFVEAGLTPFEALKIATVNAAEYLSMTDEIGTVSVGKRANLLLLNANPLEAIENTKTIAGVVVGGEWRPSAEL